MIADTRNECGDSRSGSPASLSRRLTNSQIRLLVSGLVVSVFAVPFVPARGKTRSQFILLNGLPGIRYPLIHVMATSHDR